MTTQESAPAVTFPTAAGVTSAILAVLVTTTMVVGS